MSRIGKKPINVPSGVTVTLNEGSASVKGPKGEVSVIIHDGIIVKQEGEVITLENSKGAQLEALYGTDRANLYNAVIGVSQGFKIEMSITGIGYRAAMRGDAITLHVGFSHEVVIKPLPGVKISTPDETHIVVEGFDKQKVGQTAALIHDVKRPEPYKGKGIAYKDEHIIRKEGKRATAGKK